jgi:hypothetical protein
MLTPVSWMKLHLLQALVLQKMPVANEGEWLSICSCAEQTEGPPGGTLCTR